MKNLTALIGACGVIAATAGMASADLTVSERTGGIQSMNGEFGPRGDPSGDTYFAAPGIGSDVEGFFLNSDADGVADSVAGAGSTQVGLTIDGQPIFTSSTITGGPSTFDIEIRLFTTGTDLAATGISGPNGGALDTAGFFLGGNAGGDPFEFSEPVFTNSATIDAIDGTGASLLGGGADISGFANFTDGVGGTWDGGLGVTFGAGSAGAGIVEYVFQGNFTKIPAPGTAVLMGFGGLAAARRRR